MRVEKLVPDTSVVIEGVISEKLQSKELEVEQILIHEAIIAELEHQANENKEIGFVGLAELKKLRELSTALGFSIEFSGKRPNAMDIKFAKSGEIDNLIRTLALETGATLYTADKVMSDVAETKGISVIFEKIEIHPKKMIIEKFFDASTMSVHIREKCAVKAKKGKPGNWQFVQVTEQKIDRAFVREMAIELVEEAGRREDGFIEIDRPGSTIVQIADYRTVITKPPFSDGWEITIVKPVAKLKFSDYKISDKLKQRISEQAEGIIIAGAPGMGKSTFAQALAEYYASNNKIVKTVEAPRDLNLSDEITQYAISHGTSQEVHDVLLLSRPDYTIFDEMRNTEDFKLFADLRLAGVGMLGVVHATIAVDAIQRFIGRIELGVIPQVIDTVVFIKNGEIFKVFEMKMEVKVPSGMTEADLARPVVTIRDFETEKLEYEIYSYGEETVVIPVTDLEKDPSLKLMEKGIAHEFEKYADVVKVEMISREKATVYVPERCIAKIIGKQGQRIEKIEQNLGIGINIEPLQSKKKAVNYEFKFAGKNVKFFVDKKYAGTDINFHINDEYLMTVKVGSDSVVNVRLDNQLGESLANALKRGDIVELIE
jgi:ATPase